MSIKYIDAKEKTDTGYDDLLFKSYNGNFEYIHTALNTITGTGINGYFTAQFSGNVTEINGLTVKVGTNTGIDLETGAVYSFIISGNTINFKQGDGGLAITVIASEIRPENPKENTIWINSSLDLNTKTYHIGYEPPENPQVNDLYFKISAVKLAYLYADKKQQVAVSLQSANYYNGSVWTEFTSFETFADGTWHSAAEDMYVYYRGNENNAVTGGWKAIAATGYTKPTTMTKASESLNIVTSAPGTGSLQIGAFVTNSAIDITPYNQITFLVSNVTTTSSNREIGVTRANTGSGILAPVKKYIFPSTGTYTLDISDVNGLIYPYFMIGGGGTHSSQGSGQLYEMEFLI